MQKKILLISIIVICTLLCLSFYNVTFAKYVEKAVLRASVDVAVPIYEQTAKELAVELEPMEPGETITYNFVVANVNENNKISEVSLNYYIQFGRSTNLPISISLTSDQEAGNLLNASLATRDFYMPHSTLATHSYTLTITWDENAKEHRWADAIEMLYIYIYVSQ